MKSFKLFCVTVLLILSEKIIVNGQDNSEGENINAVSACIMYLYVFIKLQLYIPNH